MKTLTVKLPYPQTVDGVEVEDAVVRMLTVKEQAELEAKRKGMESTTYLTRFVHKRLVRLGPIDVVPLEAVEALYYPNFEALLEACIALDNGFDDLDDFRNSERYQRLFGGA